MADDFGNRVTWEGERVMQGGREVESGGSNWWGKVPRYRTDGGFTINKKGEMVFCNSPAEIAKYHKKWDIFWLIRKITKFGIVPTLILAAYLDFKSEILDPSKRDAEKIKLFCLSLAQTPTIEDELKKATEKIIKQAVRAGVSSSQLSLLGSNLKVEAKYFDARFGRKNNGFFPAKVVVKIYPLDLERPADDSINHCSFTVNAVTGEIINPFGYRSE